jgi:potassium efflux system protein
MRSAPTALAGPAARGGSWSGRLLAACLLLACVVPDLLQAQVPVQPERPFTQLATGWTRALDRIAQRVAQPDLVEAEIESLRGELQTLRSAAEAQAALAREDLAAVRAVLAPLQRPAAPEPTPGTPPATPPPPVAPESDEVKQQREQLTRQASEIEGRVRQAEAIVARVDLQLAQLAKQREAIVISSLSRRGPPPLLVSTWQGALTEAGAALSGLGRDVGVWLDRGPVATALAGKGLRGSLAGAVGVFLLWLLLAALRRRFGRRPVSEPPSYRERVVAACIDGLGMVAIPILALLVVSGALLLTEPPQRLARLVLEIASDTAFVLLVYGLSEAALAPRAPMWRVMPFSDASAQRLSTSLQYFALTLGVGDVVLRILTPERGAAPAVTSIGITLTLAVAMVPAIVALQTRSWRRAAVPGAPSDAGPAAIGGGAWSAGRGILGLVLPVALGAALIGYINLAETLLDNVVISTLLIVLAMLVHGVVRDLLEAAAAPDTPTGRWMRRTLGLAADADLRWRHLVLLAVDILLLLFLAFALPATWGVDPETIRAAASSLVTGVKIAGRTISLLDVVLAVGAFFLVMAIVHVLRGVLREQVLTSMSVPAAVRYSIDAGVNFVGLVVAALAGIVTLGVDFSSIALILGALSVGIGLGLQNIANNTISGLILLVERPISVGDWVVVGNNEGIVRRINIRATEIETFQRATVMVPNSLFLQNPITNWTYGDNVGRVDLAVTVPLDADVRTAEKLLLEVAQANPLVTRVPAPAVIFRQIAPSGLELELRVWLGNIANGVRARTELNYAILDSLTKAGIRPGTTGASPPPPPPAAVTSTPETPASDPPGGAATS